MNAVAPISLEADSVTVTYPSGQTALHDATLSLQGGTICALVGVNGSGKSTLFKALMGFVMPSRGTVRVNQRPVREAQRKSWVAYVPQAEEVDWSFPVSVHDVVMMGRYGSMNFLRIPRAADREAVELSLRRVGMWDLRDRQIGELSGGQKKRVFVARALAQGGRIILLDEPFTGVDVKTEEAIIGLLRELRDDGCLILVSTHNLGSVPEFCDQVVLINRTILAVGPLDEVFTPENLAHAFGGALRAFEIDRSTVQAHDGRHVTVLTDDERPLVLGKSGHLEYRERAGREALISARERDLETAQAALDEAKKGSKED
ncbi:MAG: ATP-binding cassette domain-containing protein [Verrucomicrobia bacterium]|nr:ATP-binding cassette domain-containing protein [Verrucomicrobiota bacterium]